MSELLNTNSILSALEKINLFLETYKIENCLIGGIAVQIRGEPRFTSDIDICILSDLSDQERVIDLITKNFTSLVDDPKDLAFTAQLLPIRIDQVSVDLSIGLTGFERQVIERAPFEVLAEKVKIRVATSEDLIIFKCLAARPKDIQDIDSILRKNLKTLDYSYIIEVLKDFESVLETNELLDLFEKRRNEI